MADETEEVADSASSQRLFKLMYDIGVRRASVNKAVCGRNGDSIRGRKQRLNR